MSLLTKIIILCLLLCGSAFGAVTELDGWVEGRGARTISAGTDRLIVFHAVSEYTAGAYTLDSVKYGSVKLTRKAEEVVGTADFRNRASIWIMKEADIPGGSNSFSVFYTNGPSDSSYASAVYAGVDQTTPISDTAGRVDGSTFGLTDSISLTVTDGSYTTMSVCVSSFGRTFTWSGSTEEFEYTIADASAALASNIEASAGTNKTIVTLSSSATRGVMIGCTIAPAANGEPAVDISYVRRIKEGEGK